MLYYIKQFDYVDSWDDGDKFIGFNGKAKYAVRRGHIWDNGIREYYCLCHNNRKWPY